MFTMLSNIHTNQNSHHVLCCMIIPKSVSEVFEAHLRLLARTANAVSCICRYVCSGGEPFLGTACPLSGLVLGSSACQNYWVMPEKCQITKEQCQLKSLEYVGCIFWWHPWVHIYKFNGTFVIWHLFWHNSVISRCRHREPNLKVDILKCYVRIDHPGNENFSSRSINFLQARHQKGILFSNTNNSGIGQIIKMKLITFFPGLLSLKKG